MSNQQKNIPTELLEQHLADLDHAPFVKTSVVCGVAWTLAFKVGNLVVTRARLDDMTDPMTAALAARGTLDDRKTTIERRIDEASDALGWIASYGGNPEFMPTGKRVAEMLQKINDKPVSATDHDKLLLEALGDLSPEEIKASDGRLSERRKAESVRVAAMATTLVKPIISAIDSAMKNRSGTDQTANADAISILNKMGEKVDSGINKCLDRARMTRRPSIIAAIGAERRVLQDVLTRIDKHFLDVQQSMDVQVPDEVVEQAAEAA